MRTLYIDCGMGAAGDMLTAALLELVPNREEFLREFNELGIPNVELSAEKCVKCGIAGTHVCVKIHGQEEGEVQSHHVHNSGLCRIEDILSRIALPGAVKLDVLAVYRLIAEAESHVHGIPVEQIHFHEVGNLDAIADVTAVCMLMYKLKPDEVIASPVHVGCGTVRCAHGILPVPAPATAEILKSVPIYGGEIRGELCTPTGAALLKYFVTKFGDMPVMKLAQVGYGMGKKDFESANCVRVLMGQREDGMESITELSCNVDDMTGEAVGFALEQFLCHGALDAYTVPVGMKKSRPGFKICVLCRNVDKNAMVSLIFKHTTTIGIRENTCRRYTLNRKLENIDTSFGIVRRKISSGYGVERMKYEYEDLIQIAREQNKGIQEILTTITEGNDLV